MAMIQKASCAGFSRCMLTYWMKLVSAEMEAMC